MTSLPYLLGEGFSVAAKSALEEMTLGLPLLAQVEKSTWICLLLLVYSQHNDNKERWSLFLPCICTLPRSQAVTPVAFPWYRYGKLKEKRYAILLYFLKASTVYVKPLHL